MRIVIDQEAVPEEMRVNYEFDGDFEVKPHQNVKPRILMVCPPTINAYNLEEVTWSKLGHIFTRPTRLCCGELYILKTIKKSTCPYR